MTRLPPLDVIAPDLVAACDYQRHALQRLDANALAYLQGGAAARSDMNAGGLSYDAGYGYGNYSYSTPRSRETAAGNDRANAAASGTAVKLQGWNLIDNATTEIRREMTKRYSIAF